MTPRTMHAHSRLLLKTAIGLHVGILVAGAVALFLLLPHRISNASGTPKFVMATSGGGAGSDNAFGLARSADGYSYVTGFFTNTATIGGTGVSGHAVDPNMFLAKLRDDGTAVWVRTVASDGSNVLGNEPTFVTLDAQGNPYVSGYYTGTATFGATPITSIGNTDMFLAKYDPDGNVLWVKSGGSVSNSEVGRSVAVDSSGNAYLVGECGGGAAGSIFSGITVHQNGNTAQDWCLAKYDSNGAIVLAKDLGGISGGFDFPTDIRTDNASLYIGGVIANGVATFDLSTITSAGGNDIVLTKYDLSGNLVWIHQIGSTASDSLSRAALVGNSYYVSGSFGASLTIGTTPLTDAGSSDAFLAKYDTDGNFQWVRQLGSTGGESAPGLAADGTGVYWNGSFSNTASFTDGYAITSAGSTDAFFSKYTDAGTRVWTLQAGGTSADVVRSCVTNGSLWCIGTYAGTASVGLTSLTSAGGNDFFFTKISEVVGADKPSAPLVPTPGLSASTDPLPSDPQAVVTYHVSTLSGSALENVHIEDPACRKTLYASGDDNADGILQPSENWTFVCHEKIQDGYGTIVLYAEANGFLISQTVEKP